ncbi:hypothetical protein GCM10022278_20810 [Allohahella marinimesophila]|uniref:Uncharacterized protein n=1 Tax=Allohahella marinimesophila TaxID=1054972 RepID=A0ABP7PC00_9GAMM
MWNKPPPVKHQKGSGPIAKSRFAIRPQTVTAGNEIELCMSDGSTIVQTLTYLHV